jgi:heme/copper-type cytochrome/quinol oxidase subunit 2
MSSRRVPALIALVGVVVAVGLFLLLQDDTADEEAERPDTTTTDQAANEPEDSEERPEREQPPPEPEVPVIEIDQSGRPVGGVAELEVPLDDRIRFIVESAVAEEVHLHGYDVSMDVEAGGEVEFDVPADTDGVYEVELEHSVVPIAEISVVP